MLKSALGRIDEKDSRFKIKDIKRDIDYLHPELDSRAIKTITKKAVDIELLLREIQLDADQKDAYEKL